MSVGPAAPTSTLRDLRLDFFRGLALFCIFIDHIPGNVVSGYTLQILGVADAAEVFILIAGYAAGMVYGRQFLAGNTVVGIARIYHRVWQLYIAHIFLFVIFMATVARTVAAFNSSLYTEELRAADFLREPETAIFKALTLQFQPVLMDILPLYIALLALLPLGLWGFRKAPGLVLGASLALWLAVQFTAKLALPAYPGPDLVWPFNPFAWQALFLLCAYFGWRSVQGPLPILHHKGLFWAAVVYAVFCFWLRSYAFFHAEHGSIPGTVVEIVAPYLGKGTLSPLRFLDVLAWGLIVARLVQPQSPFLAGRLARPFVMCGRHSLHVFCVGILLSVIGHFIINESSGGTGLQIAISCGGVVVMTGVATLMEWYAGITKRSPRSAGSPVETGAA